MIRYTKAAIFAVAVSVLAGCSEPPPPLAAGTWRATAELPGGEMPFGLEVEHGETGLAAFVRNGEERVAVGEVLASAGSAEGETGTVRLGFPAFNNHIEASLVSPESMTGELVLTKRGGELQRMPFRAAYGDASRFAAGADPAGDVAGRWAVTFTEEDGTTTPAVAEFSQAGGVVTGTFMTPTGDYRFLEGGLSGDTLSLSTFDGAHAFLFRARLDENGMLGGDFWSGTKWHERWRAYRDENASLPDPKRLTWLREGYDRFTFEFPDLDGTPVSLDDPRFDDKVVLVTLMGTWCPNCHDEAAYLSEYFRANADRGLAVVALLFEHFEDFDTAAAQGLAFRTKFDIGYEILVAGYSDKTSASETLPMLNRVLAYPTLIAMDRRGEIRYIHTGFKGPGTGSHYERWVAEFEAMMESLLAAR